MLNDPLTCEGKMAWKDDVNSSTVQVKHNAKVDGYASQNGKTVDKGPVGRIQGDLKAARIQKSSSYHITTDNEMASSYKRRYQSQSCPTISERLT